MKNTLHWLWAKDVHYNSDHSYLFINSIQQYQFKAKDTEIKANKFCLGNTSEELKQKQFWSQW